MASPTSFAPLLERWCNKIKPKRILEWGPGISTKLMNVTCPNTEIISIEHQKKYYDEWKKKLSPTIDLRLREEPEETEMETYVNPDVEGKFDLIFVDGRNRVMCLKVAKTLVSKDGVVILHDAERTEYDEGIKLFDIIDDEDGTVCLKLR